MELIPTDIPEVIVVVPKKFGDHRGFFSEVYKQEVFEQAGIGRLFIQDNHSLSVECGVVRGLHWQCDPLAQDKLVRVVRGRILDVAVDLRRASPTFGKHVAVELSAENWRQLYVPRGFAHGFVTLEPNTEVLYKVTNRYSPEHERAIIWNDPDLNIHWGIDPRSAVLSGRDQQHPRLRELKPADLF